MGTRRLIDIDDELWEQMKAQAKAQGRIVIEEVGLAFRAWLAGPVMKTADEQLQDRLSVPRETTGAGTVCQGCGHPLPKFSLHACPGRAAAEPAHYPPTSREDVERLRLARQEWLRTHPEDERA